MDIVHVTSFAGKASVSHLKEEEEEGIQRGLYWRQVFDHRSGSLSVSNGCLNLRSAVDEILEQELRKYCARQRWYNPDEVMIFCSENSCNIWNYQACLCAEAFEQVHHRLKGIDTATVEKKGSSKESKIEERTHRHSDLFFG